MCSAQIDYRSNSKNAAIRLEQFGAEAPPQNRPHVFSAVEIDSGNTYVTWLHSSEVADYDFHSGLLANSYPHLCRNITEPLPKQRA